MHLSNSSLFLLNAIELCVAVFRGPDTAAWAAIAESGVPELRNRVQHYSGFPVGPLTDLDTGLTRCAETDGDLTALEPEFVRLFIAGPGGVPAPPYESCHLDNAPRIMGQAALDMRDRLAEAGLAVDLDSNEPPDHITIELEYLYHLLATGWTGNNPELTAQGVEFAVSMLPWVRRFRTAVAQADGHPVFLAAADLTVATVEAAANA